MFAVLRSEPGHGAGPIEVPPFDLAAAVRAIAAHIPKIDTPFEGKQPFGHIVFDHALNPPLLETICPARLVARSAINADAASFFSGFLLISVILALTLCEVGELGEFAFES